MSIYFISFLLLVFLVYGTWYFFFNVYEVNYKINLVKKLTGSERLFEIENIPINLLGRQVPFRKLDFDFEVTGGKSLIDIRPRKDNKELFFQTSKNEGKIIFVLKTKLSLFPQKIEFDLSNNF